MKILFEMSYVKRRIKTAVKEYTSFFPVTAILGPRQCGKTTLVKKFMAKNSIYLDLEKASDRSKLNYAEQFFIHNQDKQICLDEIQRVPELFPLLRSMVDENRQPGKYIILGSASRDLIQQSSESLAGRIGYLELSPFLFSEIQEVKTKDELWLQGGFPDSLFASKKLSEQWRRNFIRTFLEQDIPQLGFKIPSGVIMRLWKMVAHNHGQLLNFSALGKSLGVTHTTVRSYIDVLKQTFMTREIQPYESNLKKRLVKSPKLYIRDSGILHALLDIPDFNTLFSHPIYGFSWEGLVIESICAYLDNADCFFYRTAHGAELDLVVHYRSKIIAFECKVSDAPKPTKGFWQALEDVKPDVTYIVSPLADKYPIREDIWVVGLEQLFKEMKRLTATDLDTIKRI